MSGVSREWCSLWLKVGTTCLFQASGLLLYFDKSIRSEVLHFQLPLTQIYYFLVVLQTEFLFQPFSQNRVYLWLHCNHSTSQLSKSIPQPVTLKKLKLNSSMKTYKTSRTNTRKRCPFHYRGLECKSKKPRDTWGNSQVWSWSTKWSRAKANSVLPREHTGHSKHPLPTAQEKTPHMDITRWSIPKSDWLYSLQSKMEKLYTASKNKTGSWLWLRS